MRYPAKVLLLSLACSAALAAQAQASPGPINLPAGELSGALNALAKQSGTNLVYRADQLKGQRTGGVQGATNTDQALDRLLQGSGFQAKRDTSGAVLIVRADTPAVTTRKAPAPSPAPQSTGGGSAQAEPVTQLETLQVTGSRIPRAQLEGPAPITVINAEQIKAAGLTSVPDLLRSLSQNSGTVQGQQNTTGAQSTPGAQAVDLRGLGPNHTLVLINGRRIADFPLPLNGKSNFTDIGSIPLGMIERVEILTGSASAVYGSDAMAGVINFILKKSTDGPIIDYRVGTTSEGGGQSHNLSLTTGFERGNFSGIVGVELQSKAPVWGYQRDVQDSTLDGPTSRSRLPVRVAQLYDWDEDYALDPTDDCVGLSGLNNGNTQLSLDRWDEPYCGSDTAMANRTISNARKGVNAYGSFEYRFNDRLTWFADAQLGRQEVRLMTGNGSATAVSDNMGWQFHDPNAAYSNDKVFYNEATERYEVWSRQFSPEEVGGLQNRMNSTVQKTLALTTGFKGAFNDNWNWEAAFNHSQYKADVKMPRIKAAAANQLFLGDLQGYDDDGFAIYNADPSRLFTPLTTAEFNSIAAMSTWHPEAKNDNLSFTVDSASLFTLPAGDVGFAGALEYGRQSYDVNPDPLALTADAYYGPQYGDGSGDRDRWSVAGEFRIPLLTSLQASLAGRYDQYKYGSNDPGKATYSAGLEWRPLDTLLVRASYGTGFRAPDMHYLFAGDDYYRKVSTDYFQCRTDEPGFSDGECYDDGYWDSNTLDVYRGNTALDVETSKSFTAGFVWSPTANFDLAVDYYKIQVSNQVQSQDREILRMTEANCRLGVTDSGASVDINSPTCQDAIARIIRDGSGTITSVHFAPINIAYEETSGVDVTANYRLNTTSAGNFRFNASYNWSDKHSRRLYPGDPLEDMLDVGFSATTLPRQKGNVGVTWDKGALGASLFGNYLGRVANYDNDAWTKATWRFNAGASYAVHDHLRIGLTVNNLLNNMPPKDATWTPYPYYDTSWFDAIGRTYYLQLTWKLGGKAL